MADFNLCNTSFSSNLNALDTNVDLDCGNMFSSEFEDFFKESSHRKIVHNDLFLNTLDLYESNNNVLDVVDLPQDLLEDDQVSPAVVNGLTERSPWHESDSGVSETTSITGSPKHYFYDQAAPSADNTTPIAAMQGQVCEEDLDNELAAYLQNDCEMPSPTKSNSDIDDLSFFTQSFENDQLNIENESSHNIKTKDIFTPVNALKDRSRSNEGLDSFPATQSKPSEVKILKVVRPSNSSTGVTSEDIAKAMEERSKKNAAQAKLNREKKKAYIQSLEAEVDCLKSSNEAFQGENARLKSDLKERDEEIAYLKSVLANSSSLSNLLKNITEVKEVKLSASIMSRKRSAKDDHCYNLVENAPQKRARLIDENLKKAGVCLHVMGGSACLEFCAHCAKLAQKSHAHS